MTETLRLLKLLRPWAGWIILGIFFSLVTLLANVTLMAMSGWFIASMALAGLAGITMNYFTPAAIIRAMAITRTVGRYVERLITHEATLRLVSELRRWFYNRLEPLAPAHLQEARSGDLLSRMGADISELENFYLRTLVPFCVAILAVPIFLTFAGYYSAWLALIMLGLYLATGFGLPVLVYRFGRQHSEAMVTRKAEMRSDLVEGLQGARELLVYGRAKDFQDYFGKQSSQLNRSQKRLADLQALSQSAMTLSTNLAVFAALLFLIPKVNAGIWSGPALPMVALFLMASFEVVLPLPLAVQTLITTRMAANRLFEIADRSETDTSKDRERIVGDNDEPNSTSIELDSVTFTYPNRQTPALSSFSLRVKAGEKLAILGPSGAGKSSIINLLLGFWLPQEGRILINGRPHTDFPIEKLRSHFAVAPQRPHIFNSTLRGNLMLANPRASDQALGDVCQITQLQEFISALPDGLDSYVGEGGERLSGGQLRRLSIARALLSNAPVLILDEPGEGLAKKMEAQIIEAIVEHMPERTLLLITHSPVGLGHMNRIITLDEKPNALREQFHLLS